MRHVNRLPQAHAERRVRLRSEAEVVVDRQRRMVTEPLRLEHTGVLGRGQVVPSAAKTYKLLQSAASSSRIPGWSWVMESMKCTDVTSRVAIIAVCLVQS